MRFERSPDATSFVVDSEPRDVICRWDAPDGTQKVTLSPSLIGELRQAAIEAFLAIPRRGIEIGGLLFGQVRQLANTVVFEIEAFADVPCEHRFGPSYVLDDLDRGQLVELLARHQRNGSPPVVGFYRSYTSREARLDESDRELIRTFFPQRHFTCLLLQPLSMTKSAAGFQFCGGGDPTPVPAYAPFPLDAAQMKQEPVESLAAAPVRKKEPPPRPGPAAPRPAYGSRFLLPTLLFVLAATASAGIYGLWKAPRAAHWAQVHLDAQPSERELVLRWDAASPAAVQATRGALAVTDGPTPFEIPLTVEQVRRGTFSYSPAHADLWLQLRFYDKENSVTADSLRVMRLPHPSAMVTDVANAPPTSPVAVLHEVEPAIPASIRARIQAPAVVPVLVNVDASGHVTQAWSKATGYGLDRYLADAAVRAARKWTFAPARSQDGSPVAAMKTISFEFTPAGQ